MYNLEHLRMFVESAQSGSFSACARKLGKVQSAVSQGIANLEIELNTTLFDRSTRKPSLTPQGERLLPFARSVLQ
ncbi:LysR family transcriptional regulator [Psychromonas hadalis]|uniref:LysR family transcriptional regulator n=1 Tax=Psychromonas hadalis TaxID=211669 RepID=UPI001B7F85E4|nr:LysR family transcriptional regulator [Psychromonas hadalis]